MISTNILAGLLHSLVERYNCCTILYMYNIYTHMYTTHDFMGLSAHQLVAQVIKHLYTKRVFIVSLMVVAAGLMKLINFNQLAFSFYSVITCMRPYPS